MTDRPEERRCPVCDRNGLLDFHDHVAACRRKRQLARQHLARRRARNLAKDRGRKRTDRR